MTPKVLWRLGHYKNPLSFPPQHLCSWHNRFDDPLRIYRTLYGASHSITCLRELLADLRPNPKAITEFDEIFSDASRPSLTIAGVVSSEWRRAHILVHAKVRCMSGRFADLDKKTTTRYLNQKHSTLLAGFGIHKLQINHLRSQERIITQQFSRSLYDEGYAGITFRSRLDAQPCFALFEERAILHPSGRKAIRMTEDWPELIQVCGEYSLILRTS